MDAWSESARRAHLEWRCQRARQAAASHPPKQPTNERTRGCVRREHPRHSSSLSWPTIDLLSMGCRGAHSPNFASVRSSHSASHTRLRNSCTDARREIWAQIFHRPPDVKNSGCENLLAHSFRRKFWQWRRHFFQIIVCRWYKQDVFKLLADLMIYRRNVVQISQWKKYRKAWIQCSAIINHRVVIANF